MTNAPDTEGVYYQVLVYQAERGDGLFVMILLMIQMQEIQVQDVVNLLVELGTKKDVALQIKIIPTGLEKLGNVQKLEDGLLNKLLVPPYVFKIIGLFLDSLRFAPSHVALSHSFGAYNRNYVQLENRPYRISSKVRFTSPVVFVSSWKTGAFSPLSSILMFIL